MSKLLLLLLSHFSRVRLCDPIPGILQLLRMSVLETGEHWSGLPFPPPMHKSGK